MRKEKIFLSRSICVAMEMVRIALQHLPKHTLCGAWKHINIKADQAENAHRLVSFEILASPGIYVCVVCHVYGESGDWTSGSGEIQFRENNFNNLDKNSHWEFKCQPNGSWNYDAQVVEKKEGKSEIPRYFKDRFR